MAPGPTGGCSTLCAWLGTRFYRGAQSWPKYWDGQGGGGTCSPGGRAVLATAGCTPSSPQDAGQRAGASWWARAGHPALIGPSMASVHWGAFINTNEPPGDQGAPWRWPSALASCCPWSFSQQWEGLPRAASWAARPLPYAPMCVLHGAAKCDAVWVITTGFTSTC